MVSTSHGPVRAPVPAPSSRRPPWLGPSQLGGGTECPRGGPPAPGAPCRPGSHPPRWVPSSCRPQGTERHGEGSDQLGAPGPREAKRHPFLYSLPRPVSAWSTLLVGPGPADTRIWLCRPAVASEPQQAQGAAAEPRNATGRGRPGSQALSAPPSRVLARGPGLQGGLGVPGSEQAGLRPVPLPPILGCLLPKGWRAFLCEVLTPLLVEGHLG